MCKKGIYFTLFKEFEKERLPYSILPLVRPTRGNAKLRADMTLEADEGMKAVHLLARSLMTHKAGYMKEDDEFLRRQGNINTTVNAAGEKTLHIPECVSAQRVANLIKKNLRGGLGGDISIMTNSQLRDVCVKEAVHFKASWSKAQLLNAIKAGSKFCLSKGKGLL